MFGQTFNLRDLPIIGILVLLEGVLSIDNAVVLGLLARRLPEEQRKKALSYGLIGALVFRVAAVILANLMMQWHIVQLLGGMYLAYIALKHLLFDSKKPHARPTDDAPAATGARFWPTVLAIELTDIAFAIDSILAAVALVADETPVDPHHRHPKLWVIITGGMIGVVLIRAAAAMFIRLLDRFPHFETAAYLLVLVIGDKLLADWGFNEPGSPPKLNFSSPSSWAFWVFWGVMALCLCVGFLPGKKARQTTSGETEESTPPGEASQSGS